MSRVSLAVLTLFLLTERAAAQSIVTHERILIPLQIHARPGAAGSLWRTELTVRNEGDTEMTVFQSACGQSCTCVIVCRPFPPIHAHDVLGQDYVPIPPGDNDVAAFLYVDRTQAANLSLAARLFEVSHGVDPLGTEVPLIRESEALTGSASLPHVAIFPDARAHLRVYGISSPSGEGVVRVRVFAGLSSITILDQTSSLSGSFTKFGVRIPAPDDVDATGPGYLEILLPTAQAGEAEYLRVHVEPITPQFVYWMMASVTTNANHRVTLFTPQ